MYAVYLRHIHSDFCAWARCCESLMSFVMPTDSCCVRAVYLTHVDDVADHERWAERLGCSRIIHEAEVGERYEMLVLDRTDLRK